MKLNKYQKGISFWSFSFAMFLIGFTAYTIFKIFPIYMEDFNVTAAIESVKKDTEEFHGAMSVHQAIMKRLAVNNVTRITKDDLSVTRDGQTYLVNIDYDVIIPFVGNISLLLTFSHSASVRASV